MNNNEIIGGYIKGIDHIGIAVADIDEALKMFVPFGYEIVVNPIIDEYRSINVCFIKMNGVMIELVAPAYADRPSPVDSFIKSRRGYEIYHICYETDDIERQMEIMMANGYIEIHKLAPAIAMDNRRVVYLYNRKMGLVELAESSKK